MRCTYASSPHPVTAMADDLWIHEATDTSGMETVDLLLASSDEESEKGGWGGSRPGKARNVDRRAEEASRRLQQQYFVENPIYTDGLFKRRFRVSKVVFQKVFEKVIASDDFFRQRKDCTGKVGLSPHQKVTAAFRILAYGISADSVDELLGMAKTTALKCLDHFVISVIQCFASEYLRNPTDEDTKRLLRQSAARGFPGMLGSIDCCKWMWKNCPTAWHGQYQGKEGAPAVTLEAIADHSLWIWHAFFGFPGSANDINVLQGSTLCNKIAEGTYPPAVEYEIAGSRRNKPYWLADGIYPKWPIFVQTIPYPTSKKEECFSRNQEFARKDVERAFGVLQSKWHIIAHPARFWSKEKMKRVMKCCIILHNMAVEDRSACSSDVKEYDDEHIVKTGTGCTPFWETTRSGACAINAPPGSLAALCESQAFLQKSEEYFVTRQLVMDHLWMHEGSSVKP